MEVFEAVSDRYGSMVVECRSVPPPVGIAGVLNPIGDEAR